MKALAITFMYNEAPYLPMWINYYRNNGCDLYVIDNCSTDDTVEVLKRYDVPHHSFDTGGSFHLTILQEEADKVIHQIKPEWVVYAGCDLFHVFDKPIIDALSTFKGNQVELRCFGALNTGESFDKCLPANYFYWNYWKDICLISKYDDSFSLCGDDVKIDNIDRRLYENGLMINYGACKPAAEQEEKLKRREKVWKEGLRYNTGRHFRKGKAKNWTYDKETAIDIRETEDYQYVQRILDNI